MPPLDDFFNHYYRRRPVNATFTGVHEYDADLPEWSAEGLESLGGEMHSLRQQFASHPADPAVVDSALADAFLEIQIAEVEGDHFQRGNPALYTGEAVFSVVSLLLRDFAPAAERVGAIESRLRGISEFLETACSTIGDKAVPASWTVRALTECDGAVKLFGDGLVTWCHEQHLDSSHTETLADAGREALAGVAAFRSWLESRADAPPRQSGCGPEFYDLLLLRGHWDTRSRQDLLAEALERFEGADARLQEMATALDPGGWPSVADRLAQRHPTMDGYLDAFQSTWDACRRRAVEWDVVTWPDFPIRYVSIPAWAKEAAPHLYFLNYRSPAPEDPPHTVDYLVPAVADERQLRSANDSVIKLNHVVHHGALGHHVQNFNAYRGASRVGRVAAVDCASRIGMFCGGSMAEGWACYATDVMGEAGFLSDLELVAEQHARLRQLARAIVDIELHQHTMTEDDARRFHRERVGMAGGAAAREVTRTAMFPGTAVMYWLGTQGIHSLRAQRQRAEGRDFSLRAFHDRFLSYGSIPVAAVAQLMNETGDF
jgi:hypothetical protein